MSQKLIKATWDQYRAGVPNNEATKLVGPDAFDDIEHVPELRAVRATHRATGRVLRFDQTGATMEEAPPEKAPVVPLAPEASGTSRTQKSSRR